MTRFITVSDPVRAHFQDSPDVLSDMLNDLNNRMLMLFMSMAGRNVRFDYDNMPHMHITAKGE